MTVSIYFLLLFQSSDSKLYISVKDQYIKSHKYYKGASDHLIPYAISATKLSIEKDVHLYVS